jgi:hypothetical protein
MFQSTTTENFQSWEKFLDAYYEPIRTALGLLPFVGRGRADDLAQSFFLKMYERDLIKQRPDITRLSPTRRRTTVAGPANR